MYLALWHALPGPFWLRALIALLMLATALYTLVTWGFPWADLLISSQGAVVVSV